MTVTTTPIIKDSCLVVQGNVVLTRVPVNVQWNPASYRSAFIGASSTSPSSRHVFSLGVLEGYKLMCLFRFKIWWMIPSFGKSGSEVPIETQLLLLEAMGESRLEDDVPGPTNAHPLYILFLPVLDGQFRASLQGTSANELQICVESGDPDIQTSEVLEALFINSGDNPYDLMKDSIKILEKHKGTFCHKDKKKIPAHLDWFGWCTWDAFYTKVTPQGIQEGLKSLTEGRCPPKFLVIDDGWQDTHNAFLKEGEKPTNGIEYATRLAGIMENKKFQASGSNNYCTDLKDFILTIKEKFGLKFVYMWHALVGYWGGLDPSSEAMKKYNPKMMFPVLSPGNKSHIRCGAMESLVRNGVGMIDPSEIYDFYNDMHSYLQSCGADGVKVDIQNVVEVLAYGCGGRVSLMKKYQEALEESVAKNFKDNNLICCMSQTTDYFYSSMKSAITRASEDYMPHVPSIQTSHVAAVAFNSLLMGEIVVPDWDMFHSKHFTAEFHAAARALSGSAVYVSDTPGEHDFKIIRRLVLPDGSVLRARYAGRPTQDSLFSDPVMDGKSLLKIWNLNKLCGILGVFNCQGAGCWPSQLEKEDVLVPNFVPSQISGHASPQDVESLEEVGDENWNGDCAVYAFFSGSLSTLPKKGTLEVSLGVLKCEIFTISPIRAVGHNIQFAPIGLLDMYNSGGAIQALNCSNISTSELIRNCVKVQARGCGHFGAYSSIKPMCCIVDMKEEEFIYNANSGLLTFEIQGHCNSREICIVY